MVTGARRLELCGLRSSHLHLTEGYPRVSRNLVQRGGERHEKDTKTHQGRLLELDETTAQLLTGHRMGCQDRAALCETALRPDGVRVLLRTPAAHTGGRLDHGDGGMTLRVYTHFLRAPGRLGPSPHGLGWNTPRE